MLTDTYRDFKRYIDDKHIRIIERKLGHGVRPVAADMFGHLGNNREALEGFFHDVCKRTGESHFSESNDYYENLIKKWQVAGNRSLAVATYYYLHTTRAGQDLARDIDQAILGGKTFVEQHGKVPGGYEPEREPPSATTSLQGRFQPELRLSPPPKSSQSSHYSRRALDVLGRDEEQRTLKRFVDAGPGFRWMQIAGAGGQGKSRLAYELILELSDDWVKGFLLKTDLSLFSGLWTTWKQANPHLIVIDYVVGFESQIGDAMREMAARPIAFEVPVCVLLIERQRWDRVQAGKSTIGQDSLSDLSEGKASWFSKLNDPDKASVNFDDLAHEEYRYGSGVVELKELRESHLITIVRLASALNGTTITETDDVIASVLRRIDSSGRPLYAYLLGQALWDDVIRLDWGKHALLRFVINRDRSRRWVHFFDDSPPTLADDDPALRIALLATMTRSVDCSKVTDLNWEAPGSLVRRQALVMTDSLREEDILGVGNIISGLEPDVLGEWFILSAVERGPLLETLLDAAWRYAPQPTAGTLVRLAGDFAEHPSTLRILDHEPPNDLAKSVYTSYAQAINEGLHVNRRLSPAATICALEQAASVGLMGARRYIAICYYDGRGLEQDRTRAMFWFRRGVEAGDPEAMNGIGLCYGNSVESYDQAIEWFHRSIEAGGVGALASLGSCYRMGRGVKLDFAKAAELFKRGADAGLSEAMRRLGQWHKDGCDGRYDLHKAVEWFRKAAEAGNPSAMNALGICYRDGEGMKSDPLAGMHWFRAGVRAGSGESMTSLGVCYSKGTGIERDLAQAFFWFREGAKAGDGRAMYHLGICYERGEGVEVNFEEAANWYRSGKDARDLLAANRFTHLFTLGLTPWYKAD